MDKENSKTKNNKINMESKTKETKTKSIWTIIKKDENRMDKRK